MEILTKKQGQLRWLCALILLVACSFRTWDVLSHREVLPHREALPVAPTEAPDYPILLYQKPLGKREPLTFDASFVEIDNRSGSNYDLAALLDRPFSFPQTDKPTVLILHTHATEAYADTGDYRSEDPAENMVSIGAKIAEILTQKGIRAIHDTTLHDAYGYSDAYERVEGVIREYLQEFPTLCMVIDVHRDAVEYADGTQKAMTATVNGEELAQLLLVMGTDTEELPHPNWEENLAFAVKLQAYIGASAPDLFRNISLRSARYNEHMTPYSLLLEVGSAGNTREQALRSATYFAQKLAVLLLSSDSLLPSD